MRAVIAARPDVVSPPSIRIRNVAQVASAVAGSGRVDGARQRVVGSQLKVTAYLRVEVNLKCVVMRVSLVGRQPNGMETRIGQARRQGVLGTADECWQRAGIREIVLATVVLVAVLVSHVGNGQNRFSIQRVLYANAVLVARGKLVIVHGKPS